MNLTASIVAFIAAAGNPAIAIGSYQCPPGQHTVDLNTVVVPTVSMGQFANPGSRPPYPPANPYPAGQPISNMSYTWDANFALLGDPSGGTYIAPTAYNSNYGWMFHVQGGRVSCENIRFNGKSNAAKGNSYYWIAWFLEGDIQTNAPYQRWFKLKDCEFRYGGRAVYAHNYDNVKVESCRFEVDRLAPLSSPEAPFITHILSDQGSQSTWYDDNHMVGGQGIYFSDTQPAGTGTAGEGRFIVGQLMQNMYQGINLNRGLCFLIHNCNIDVDSGAGATAILTATTATNAGNANVTIAGCLVSGNVQYKLYSKFTRQIIVVGSILDSLPSTANIAFYMDDDTENVTIAGSHLTGGGQTGGYTLHTQLNTDAESNGVRMGASSAGGVKTIDDHGKNSWYLTNRIKNVYVAQNTSATPPNVYGAVTG